MLASSPCSAFLDNCSCLAAFRKTWRFCSAFWSFNPCSRLPPRRRRGISLAPRPARRARRARAIRRSIMIAERSTAARSAARRMIPLVSTAHSPRRISPHGPRCRQHAVQAMRGRAHLSRVSSSSRAGRPPQSDLHPRPYSRSPSRAAARRDVTCRLVAPRALSRGQRFVARDAPRAQRPTSLFFQKTMAARWSPAL